jgi:carboxypeptidase Q
MSMRYLPLLLVAACTTAPPPPSEHHESQVFDAAIHRDAVDRIVTAALASQGAWTALEGLVAAAPKRLAGSPGYDRAVEWAQEEMRRAGLVNVRLEPCMAPHWERGSVESLTVMGGDALAVCALGGSVGTAPEGIEAEVVEVRGRAELAALGERAKGRFVFFNEPMDPTLRDPFEAYGRAVWQRGFAANEAAKLGGVGAIVRSMSLRKDDFPHTGSMRYADGFEKVPAVAISTRAADALSARLAAGEPCVLRLELSCRSLPDAPSANVVGELMGRERPDEILVVGGHLDAWETGDGAHDDGAGCVQAIEAARLLLATGLRPRRTIRVVLYANEENGMAGAHAYAKTHAGELGRHVLALESDRGGFAPRGFDTDAQPEGMAVLGAMLALLEPIGAARLEVGGGGVDISTLAPAGVPLVGLVPEAARYFDVHHAASDTLAAVHPRELQMGAAAMAALLYMVAENEATFPRNEPKPAPR